MAKDLRISRKATAADSVTIRRMIADEHLNPMGLDWRRFLIVEEQGQVIGIGQVKQHGDGSRELASIVVAPSHKGQGIGTEIIETLMAQEPGELYLMCTPPLEAYYQRFDFVRIAPDKMPTYFKRIMGLVGLAFRVWRMVNARVPAAPVVMRRSEAADALK